MQFQKYFKLDYLGRNLVCSRSRSLLGWICRGHRDHPTWLQLRNISADNYGKKKIINNRNDQKSRKSSQKRIGARKTAVRCKKCAESGGGKLQANSKQTREKIDSTWCELTLFQRSLRTGTWADRQTTTWGKIFRLRVFVSEPRKIHSKSRNEPFWRGEKKQKQDSQKVNNFQWWVSIFYMEI